MAQHLTGEADPFELGLLLRRGAQARRRRDRCSPSTASRRPWPSRNRASARRCGRDWTPVPCAGWRPPRRCPGRAGARCSRRCRRTGRPSGPPAPPGPGGRLAAALAHRNQHHRPADRQPGHDVDLHLRVLRLGVEVEDLAGHEGDAEDRRQGARRAGRPSGATGRAGRRRPRPASRPWRSSARCPSPGCRGSMQRRRRAGSRPCRPTCSRPWPR